MRDELILTEISFSGEWLIFSDMEEDFLSHSPLPSVDFEILDAVS